MRSPLSIRLIARAGTSAISVLGLHHERGDLAGIFLRRQRHFAHLSRLRTGVVDHRRSYQVGK